MSLLSRFLLLAASILLSDAAHAAVTATRLADQALQFNRVVFDGAGSRYAAGSVTGPGAVDVDPGPDVHEVEATGSTAEAVVVKYDAEGNWLWSRTFGGSGQDVFLDLALGGSTVYAVGRSTSVDAGFDGTGSIEVTTVQGGILVALDAASGAPKTPFDDDGVVTFVPVDPSSFFSDFASFNAVTVADGVVYLGGHYVHDPSGFGFGGRPPVIPGANVGDSEQGLIAALDATTGAPLSSFSGDGIQFVGGQNDEIIHDVKVSGTTLFFAGDAETPDVAIGGLDPSGTVDNPGYVGALDRATGLPKAGFGTNGLVLCGASFCEAWRLVVTDDTVYAAGRVGRGPVQVPGASNVATITNDTLEVDDFVWALDPATGQAKTGFGGGLRVVGSPYEPISQRGRDRAPFDLLRSEGVLYLAAVFRNGGVGVGATGTGEAGDSTIVALDAVTGAAHATFSGDGIESISGGDATDALEWTPGTLTCDPTRGLTLAGDLAAGKSLVLGSDAGTALAGTQGLYLLSFDGVACERPPSDVEPPPLPAVPTYLLPKSLKVKLNAKTPAKSALTLVGTIDLGLDPVDLTKPATVDVAGFHLDVPGLTAKGVTFASKSATTALTIKTSKAGSSKADLKLKVKQDFGGTIPSDGATTVTFANADVDGTSIVDLAAGAFGLGKARGTLTAPTLYLVKAAASLKGAGNDAFALTAGLATDGPTPATLPAFTVYFGDTFAEKISGTAFVKKGDTFTYKGGKTGVTAVVVDYARERVIVKAKGVTLGSFAAGPQPVLVGLRLGADARAVEVRMAHAGSKLKY